MTKKLFQTAFLITVVFGLPLAFHPRLLLHPRVLFSMFLAVMLNMTGPSIALREAFSKTRSDGLSALAILVVGILGFMIPAVDFAYFITGFPWPLAYVGFGLALAGIGFRVWSIRVLGKFFTAKVEIQADHRVVREGPYRWIRHPSYLGAWIMYLGNALVMESAWGLLFAFFGFLFAYHYRTAVEERSLTRKLGSAYESYRRESWKMIPFVY